ncbi:UDP-N-acetylmuramoyl-tripeptide--D-alanyl-D-alanine ligase [Cribrihabitans marinus]|uniref:UDP-N-acetylmuramoyl-tripeptide--D-alanyl-D-alanine ligase n=1 Tax=Cribrihabitans marinus TaxID=1227549 RepID=A0A1H7A102_9RHOB|nr:UDP-N-acetylmuramoyl-tripeptide--D-alanyl-D-alanine ligase [Cribrihabitans marinus]GGH30209.1 UDP-N-acetylmuramoyl-tripeptide--D-alanyl-D-alanine ligase [Cribrihabitans marinus]SEJ55520.1 UDP-N-acetylmuramoyl-tripeptide--D-alanyl-D-alanine ligase [Cribrihabitans marinus]
MTLWTSTEAARATGGQATGYWQASGVSIDTRTLEPGDLFVALTATRDGHEFVAQALEKGAAAALVSRRPEGVAEDAPLLIVDDVQTALESLGRAGRDRCAARVVAVTGSVGKTSTKEMLLCMLQDQGETHASVASYNNHWGVPLTLARMPRDTDYAIIEIGMNHPGEIDPLARMARPHVALVTTVAAAHLEAFDSIEGIAQEKAAIYDGLPRGGVAVLNADIPQAQILRDKAARLGATPISFGRTARDFRLAEVEVEGQVTRAKADIYGSILGFRINSAGAHFAMNALGALAACAALGADLIGALTGLRDWRPYRGRGVRRKVALATGGALELFDDSYNANPASVGAALDVLAAAEGRRRVAILGDMKELGPQAAELHAELAELPAMGGVDVVHCIGPLMRSLHDALPTDRRGEWDETADGLAARLPDLLRAGDVVLVKGSLSVGMARVVDAIREMGHGAGAED